MSVQSGAKPRQAERKGMGGSLFVNFMERLKGGMRFQFPLILILLLLAHKNLGRLELKFVWKKNCRKGCALGRPSSALIQALQVCELADELCRTENIKMRRKKKNRRKENKTKGVALFAFSNVFYLREEIRRGVTVKKAIALFW